MARNGFTPLNLGFIPMLLVGVSSDEHVTEAGFSSFLGFPKNHHSSSILYFISAS
jgi:hypothetical protein